MIDLQYLDKEINELKIHDSYDELTEIGKEKLNSFIEIREALSIHNVSNSTPLEQLFNKCKQDNPIMTKEEFNEALDLWFYRWGKDQQIKKLRSE